MSKLDLCVLLIISLGGVRSKEPDLSHCFFGCSRLFEGDTFAVSHSFWPERERTAVVRHEIKVAACTKI
jgi:hypothetical protein